MMVVVPAVGATSEQLLQDTLKSILVSSFALAAAFAFFWQLRKQHVVLDFQGVLCLPLGLMLYALGSMAWSHAYLGGVEAIRWFVFSLILFLGANTLTLARVTHLAWCIHLGAVVASLWAAMQFWGDFKLFSQGPNPASTFVNRNFFAEFLICTLPFSVYLLTRIKDKTSVFLLTFALGFNVAVLMMTGTRSALIALLLLLIVLPALIWRYRNQRVSAGWRRGHCIAIVALFMASVACLGSINTANSKLIAESGRGDAIDRAIKRTLSMTQASEYSQGSFSIRSLMWKATGRMILTNPITGVGAGAWEVQAPRYQEAGNALEIDYYAHNELLQLIAEYGLAGWLFLLGLLAYLLRAAYKTCSDQTLEGQQEAPLRAFTLASLLVLGLVSNAGFPWRLASTGALFALCLAILAASDARLSTNKSFLWKSLRWQPIHTRCALSATALCAALTLYIAQQAIQSEAKLVQAVKLALTIAQSSHPNDPRWDETKIDMLRLLREGIAINPHYRKLTPIVADALAQWGDWKNATWIWESVLESRPYVVLLLANAARGQLQIGELSKAQDHLNRALNLQPKAPLLASLEVTILSRAGKDPEAIRRTREIFQAGFFDYELVQTAYILGLRNQDLALAIQALKLQISSWPDQAVDGWLKLGNIYNALERKNEIEAFSAYSAALAASPPYAKNDVLRMIPASYRTRLQ